MRFKNVVALYPCLVPLVTNLHLWFNQWSSGALSSLLTFDNPFQNIQELVHDLLISSLKEKVICLESIVNHKLEKETHSSSRKNALGSRDGHSNEGLVAALHGTYDPPGDLRPEGP